MNYLVILDDSPRVAAEISHKMLSHKEVQNIVKMLRRLTITLNNNCSIMAYTEMKYQRGLEVGFT
jgi:hypothetical protein